jgi:AcrR family transcriptional regulator
MRLDDKRQRILAAATAVFAERDFHRVQVSDVASRAGVGKGTVYLYFPTKDDLHRVALEASLQRTADEVDEVAERPAPVDEALRAIVLVLLELFWRRPHLLTLVQRYEQRWRGGSDRRLRVQRAIERVLARARLGGSGPGRHLAAVFLLGLARAAILSHAPTDRPGTMAARVVDVFLHGLVPRTGKSTVRRQRGAA